jgi:hypothetical protein
MRAAQHGTVEHSWQRYVGPKSGSAGHFVGAVMSYRTGANNFVFLLGHSLILPFTSVA